MLPYRAPAGILVCMLRSLGDSISASTQCLALLFSCMQGHDSDILDLPCIVPCTAESIRATPTPRAVALPRSKRLLRP